MKWIKVGEAARIAQSMEGVKGGLKVIQVSREDDAGPSLRPTIMPSGTPVRLKYESDFEDLAWELDLRRIAYGLE